MVRANDRQRTNRSAIRRIGWGFMGLWLLCGAGCMDLLPAGEPPAGDIVSNDPDPAAQETPRARENRLVTSLIGCALSRCPGAAWSLQCDPKCQAQGEQLMQEVAETAGIRRVPAGTPGCYTLRGRMEEGASVWSLLSPAGTCIWQER